MQAIINNKTENSEVVMRIWYYLLTDQPISLKNKQIRRLNKNVLIKRSTVQFFYTNNVIKQKIK